MLFSAQEMLNRAKAGDEKAKGELLEQFRPYLNVLAQRHLDDRLRGRLDFTDVVQTTFLEASRDFGAFRGENVDSLLAWLRNILRNNVHTAHQQHLGTQKRSARLETRISIASESGGSSLGMADIVPSETSTPSQRVMKSEAAAVLAMHLEKIPETQRQAIRLRYLEGLSLKEISDRMEKSEMAVAGLLKRGLRTLREEMADPA
ncbi:MAG: sigma-70 family RNA polymerase sigma factor [Pirellula sp.]|jgi:RNA polymerase sigma-70 factor (ECF subfamily)|nr:sigma-70 family RNA polymerase sigma factor [Pirellula sp.]